MAAREHDLQAFWAVFHFTDIRADAIMQSEAFPRDHFFAQHGTFGFEIKANRCLA